MLSPLTPLYLTSTERQKAALRGSTLPVFAEATPIPRSANDVNADDKITERRTKKASTKLGKLGRDDRIMKTEQGILGARRKVCFKYLEEDKAMSATAG